MAIALEVLNQLGEILRTEKTAALARGSTAVVASAPDVVALYALDLIELLIEKR